MILVCTEARYLKLLWCPFIIYLLVVLPIIYSTDKYMENFQSGTHKTYVGTKLKSKERINIFLVGKGHC